MIDGYGKLLDEYYVSILRTENGEIQYEKRYFLPPTPISKFMFESPNENGFIQCKLNEYQSANIDGNHFETTQVVFTGTQNPFKYDELGNREYSRPESLQYGNGICGLGNLELKIDIETKTDSIGTIHKVLKPTLRLTKFTTDKPYDELTLTDRVQLQANSIPDGKIVVIFSHKNLDNIAKYHLLNRTSNLYFGGSLPKSWEDPYKYWTPNGNYDPYVMRNDTLKDDEYEPSPTNSGNKFKYSDFKYDTIVDLIQDGETHWKSIQLDELGNPLFEFNLDEVVGCQVNDILS